MIWKKVESNEGKLKLIRRFRIDHEYILVGYKDKEKCSFKKVLEIPRFRNPPTENPDNDPRGPWVSGNASRTEELSVEGRENYYEVTSPSGRRWTRQWKFPKDEFEKLRKDNKIYWGKDGNNVPRLKVFPDEPKPVYVSSIIEEKGTAKSASTEVARLVGYNCFSNPKPVKLIQYLIDAAQTQHGVVLDFFAGSGTTAHAVLAQNSLDGGDRSFILVQMPELVKNVKNSPAEVRKAFRSIADITRRRVVSTIKDLEESSRSGSIPALDLGMRVFKLSWSTGGRKPNRHDKRLRRFLSSRLEVAEQPAP
jgi:adenine-specific DNA-methyltransferase